MDGCYKRLKSVDIAPTLSVLDQIEWHDTGGVCATVSTVGQIVPKEVAMLLRGLRLGGTNERWIFRKLKANQSIDPHTDDHDWMVGKNIRRFQLPLVTHPDIIMRWPDDNVELHLEPGYLYEVNNKRTHEVINNTSCERIHIQIDQRDATI